jgi:hypothetical protein
MQFFVTTFTLGTLRQASGEIAMLQPPGTVMLQSASGPIILSPTSFVVFVDETGDDSMRDNAHPIFCLRRAALAGYFHDSVDVPWKQLKAAHFPQQKGPIRAARFRARSNNVVSLSRFFRRAGVLPAGGCDEHSNAQHCKLTNYGLLAEFLIETIQQALSLLRDVSEVAIIFEKSARGDREAEEHFKHHTTIIQRNRGEASRTREVPIRYFFLPKTSATPGLEIADLIAHSAGTHVRDQLAPSGGAKGALFSSMFQKPDPKWVRFFAIQTADVN